MRYFTLATRDANGIWSPQFGSYIRSEVSAERKHYRDSYGIGLLNQTIFESGDTQAEIDAQIQLLNGNHPHSKTETVDI